MDAGQSPTCNRFDLGTSPTEIVDLLIKDYKEMHTLTNYRGSRLSFSRSAGGYIGYIFGNFIKMRQFLEETFYQAIYLSASSETIQEYATAAFKAYSFFQEVVRTPDAPATAVNDHDARFTEIELQEGKKVIIETKFFKDVAHDDVNDYDIKIRGILYDKMIALISLSERSFGFTRYENRSLKLSFYLFEKYLMGITDPAKSPMIKLFTEILKNDVIPVANTKYGQLPLDNMFSAKMDETMRFRAAMAAMVSLDMKGQTLQDNPSTMFRVLRDFDAPEAGMHVMQPGAGEYDLKYWAIDTALGSNTLIASVHGIDAVLDKKAELTEAFKNWFVLKLMAEMNPSAETPAEPTEPAEGPSEPTEPAEGPSEPTDIEKATKMLTDLVEPLPTTVGSKELDGIYGLMKQVVMLVAQGQGSDSVKLQIGKMAMRSPLVGIALSSIPGKDLGVPALDTFKPSMDKIASAKSSTFDSISMLSTFFYTLHPEYK